MSTTRISIGVLPILRSSFERFLFSSSYLILARLVYFIVVCVTPISRLFPDTLYYNREQKEKSKALVQVHTDFAPVLPVFFHTALDCF